MQIISFISRQKYFTEGPHELRNLKHGSTVSLVTYHYISINIKPKNLCYFCFIFSSAIFQLLLKSETPKCRKWSAWKFNSYKINLPIPFSINRKNTSVSNSKMNWNSYIYKLDSISIHDTIILYIITFLFWNLNELTTFNLFNFFHY